MYTFHIANSKLSKLEHFESSEDAKTKAMSVVEEQMEYEAFPPEITILKVEKTIKRNVEYKEDGTDSTE